MIVIVSILAVVAVILVAFGVLVTSGQNPFGSGTPTVTPNPTTTPLISETQTPTPEQKLVSSVYYLNNCNLEVMFSDGTKQQFTTQLNEVMEAGSCDLITAISPDKDFVFFQDLSGGVDEMLRVYSLEKNNTATLSVIGTSNLFDALITVDNELVVLYGYKDEFAEQFVTVYDLAALFEEYPDNIDQYQNVLNIDEFMTRTNLPDVSQNYSRLRTSGGNVAVVLEDGTTGYTVNFD